MKKMNLQITTFNDLKFTLLGSTSSSQGCFLKAYNNNVYYKLSNFDSYLKTFGNESIYEIIASRVGKLMGFPTLDYWLCKGRVSIDNELIYTVFCASNDFNIDKKKKVSIETLFTLKKRDNEDILQFCDRYGLSEYIYSIMIFDYVICNRDRHGANIEFLVDSLDTLIPTPIFDNGVSLLFSCIDDIAIEKFDIKSNPRANNFIGSQDLEFNLSLISKHIDFNTITDKDYNFIFNGIEDLLSEIHKTKILDMLVWRSNNAKKILDI